MPNDPDPMLQTKPSLVPDVWYLVLKELASSESIDIWRASPVATRYRQWLRALRLVSRQFEIMVKPYAFRYIRFAKGARIDKLVLGNGPRETRFRDEMKKYAEIVTWRHCLSRDFVNKMANFVESCHALVMIRWDAIHESTYTENYVSTQVSVVFSAYLGIQKDGAHCGLEEDKSGVTMVNYSLRQKLAEPQSYQEDKASKEKLDETPARTSAESNSESLSSKPRQKTFAALSLRPSGNKRSSLVPHGKLLPPIRKIKLDNCHWTWSWDQPSYMWDYSTLRCLSLKVSDMASNITLIPTLVLKGLQTFKLRHCHPHAYASIHTQRLLNSLLEDCQNLENLKIELMCWNETVTMNHVAGMGDHLLKLKLTEGLQITTSNPNDLSELISSCPNVWSLTLDMPLSSQPKEDMDAFLKVLAGARNLTNLTLHTGRIFEIDDGSRTSMDGTYDNASMIMEQLHGQKLGQAFNQIKIQFDDWGQYTKGTYPFYQARQFFSRINDHGDYEQWGSERYDLSVEEL